MNNPIPNSTKNLAEEIQKATNKKLEHDAEIETIKVKADLDILETNELIKKKIKEERENEKKNKAISITAIIIAAITLAISIITMIFTIINK